MNKQRKVTYYTVCTKEIESGEIKPFLDIVNLFNYVKELPIEERLFEFGRDSKSCYLGAFSKHQDIYSGFIKSAKHSYRPPLMNRSTGDERDNPKTLSEGDRETTHFAIKESGGEIHLILERNFVGITINQFLLYLKKYNEIRIKDETDERPSYNLLHYTDARSDFFTALNTMNRAVVADVVIDRQLLGSSSLRFSDRIFPVKQEMTLTIKAERSESIKETLIDLWNVFNRGSDIHKIRIYGTDQDDNDTKIDTSFVEKIDYISANVDSDTGVLNSTELLRELRKLAQSL
ncbi:MAG: hypothetical protein HOO91_17240 [Bacteroidales bacterium]|nr:hypothetical protein [Bacteroidales bacterium]